VPVDVTLPVPVDVEPPVPVADAAPLLQPRRRVKAASHGVRIPPW
jgi:hypothetical protein